MKSHKCLIEEQVGVANLHLININSQFLPVLCFAANLHILSWYVSGPDINFRKIIHSFSSFQKYAVAEWLDGDMWRHLQGGILLSKIVDTEKRKKLLWRNRFGSFTRRPKFTWRQAVREWIAGACWRLFPQRGIFSNHPLHPKNVVGRNLYHKLPCMGTSFKFWNIRNI